MEDFVMNVMENADFTPEEKITAETAAEWIGNFEDDQVPEGLTPELFAEIWNEHVS